MPGRLLPLKSGGGGTASFGAEGALGTTGGGGGAAGAAGAEVDPPGTDAGAEAVGIENTAVTSGNTGAGEVTAVGAEDSGAGGSGVGVEVKTTEVGVLVKTLVGVSVRVKV